MITAQKKTYASQQGLSTLERPCYSAGLLLEDDDLTAAVTYTRNMMRLMFRSLFGCGVICGLDVTAQLTCNGTRAEVTVGKGVALECLGDPIEIPKAVKVTYDADCDPMPEWLWVTVCYLEKCCRPKDVSCSPDEHGQIVQTRVMDGFEIRVYPKRPKCACSCEPEIGGTTRKSDCCDPEDDEPEEPATASTAAAPAAAASTASASGRSADIRAAERAERLRAIVENTATPGSTPPPRLPELCDCYQEHFDGICECGCCCPCVLVGKVRTTKTDKDVLIVDKSVAQGLFIDRQWVRWIRPVLVGYYKCMQTISGSLTGSVDNTINESLRDSGSIGHNRRV